MKVCLEQKKKELISIFDLPNMNISDLSDIEKIRKIDPGKSFNSTEMLPQQLETSWRNVGKIEIPKSYSDIKDIVFCGMGASVYGALVVESVFASQLRYPTKTIADYHLPSYVNNKSLVVLTSYSGTTEEVLSCAKEAKEKKAKILILTKGGELAKFARENNIPGYIFDGVLNPSSVPRLGTGYTILGLIGLLDKAGIIKVLKNDLKEAISLIKRNAFSLKEKAKLDSRYFVGKIPIIFSAEHLSGNAQILRNQYNETSKTFSAYYLIPDLNHHLMEGLQFPKNANISFLVINSSNYSRRIKKRVDLTIDVVKKNKREVREFMTTTKNPYYDFLEILVYGSYLTLYLGLLYNQNPAINPWVDYFKAKLAKSVR